MKKLVIAALAVASVAGAYASCADVNDPQTNPEAAVYQWKFTGKTGTGVVVKGTPGKDGSGCADGSRPTADEVIRVPGSLSITAYTYICDDECWNFDKYLVNPTAAQFKFAKPYKSIVYNQNFIETINVAHVIGKSATQYELEGVAQLATLGGGADVGPQYTYNLTFAGFGSYAKKAGRITSVSGNFAGLQKPPRYGKAVNGVRCPAADYWDCVKLDYAGAPNDESVAYGSWSVKYNSAASKKLAKDKKYRVLTK